MTGILILSIVTVITVLIALLTYSDIRREQSLSRQGVEDRARFLAEGLNDIIVNYIYFTDIDSLRKLTAVIQSEPDISYVHVATSEGRYLVRGRELDGQTRYPTALVDDEFVLSVARSGQADFRYDGNLLEATTPILVDDDVFGVLQLGFSGDALSAEIRGIVQLHLSQGLVLIALGVIAAYLIAGYITRPLQNLAGAAAKIGQG
ncbi:MAG: hypothetical protein OSB07_06960 [Dehalococcoidia bacterium]|nr:hypothetical protein [Dehalococcoidia bacterium]